MIYFAQCNATARIKIGFTGGDPKDRMKEINGGSPTKLILLTTTQGDRVKEKSLHAKFADLLVPGHREIFFPRKRLIIYIQTLGTVESIKSDTNPFPELHEQIRKDKATKDHVLDQARPLIEDIANLVTGRVIWPGACNDEGLLKILKESRELMMSRAQEGMAERMNELLSPR